MRSIALLCVALASIATGWCSELAKQQPCVIAEEAPSSFVNNSVNVIGGNLYLELEHLTVPGHVPLNLIQYYNSHSSYTPWLGAGMSLNYSFAMVGNDESDKSHDIHDKYEQLLSESPGGSIIRCLGKSSNSSTTHYYLDPEVIHKGFTNCGLGTISARTNLKNVRLKEKIKHEAGAKRAFWTCYLPDGSVRKHYGALNRHDAMNVLYEKKPNGTRLDFDYYKSGKLEGSIKQITAKAHRELNWLKFGNDGSHKRAPVTTSNGKTATFSYFTKDDKEYIYKVDSSDNPTIEFDYAKAGPYYAIHKIKRPDGRYLEIEYDNKGRVTAQKAPVSQNGKKHTIYRFDYHKDHTDVFDANSHKTVYNHKNSRITSIDSYLGNRRYRMKAYYWGQKEGHSWGKMPKSDEGNLLGFATLNDEGCGQKLCSYDYDERGNITKETLCGNLSGNYPWAFWIDDKGRPKDANVEKYHKYYTYSADNLLIEASEDYGPKISYRYKSGTDLVWAKFVLVNNKIIQREFYAYDDDGILIEKIVDDGITDNKSHLEGVTERLVTHIEPVRHKEGYGQGLAQEVWENYLDLTTQKLVLLKHTHYNYNKASLVTEEAVFDANNQYRYSTWYDYDHKGRLHKKTDPIGRTTTYVYDENGNKTYEKLESQDAHTIYEYDLQNRLTATTEYHYDNSEIKNSFAYDFMGNKIASTDRYGNSTHFSYDSLGRCTATHLPYEGYTIKHEYDIFDNITRETAPDGTSTSYEYTIRGKTSRINYADGSEERFDYNKNGSLNKKIDKSGTTTHYTHDKLGRITKTEIFAPSGELLSTSSNQYSSYHLVATTDAMGYVTNYRYDYAGRKCEEYTNETKTTYEYDTLGRLSCTKRYFGDNFIATYVEYDNVGRITLEKEQDSTGTVTSWTWYEYDEQDRCTLKRSGDAGEVHYRYNSKGELVAQVDECQNLTKIEHSHTSTYKKTTYDALQNSTEEQYDILGRLISVRKKDAKGRLLAATDLFYNSKNQKTKEIEHVVVNGQIDHDYSITWEYDALGRISTVCENLDKITTYSYELSGKLSTITKPDGVVLNHAYDSLGRLTHLSSTDGTLSYSYKYDLHNNPLEVVDEVSNHTSLYTYDRWNRTLSDSIEGTYAQLYTYDALGRLLTITAPDGSLITYTYDNSHLRTISWQGLQHEYKSFDLKGRPVESSLIGECGPLTQAWDKKGRITNISHAHFSQVIPEDGFDGVGNLIKHSFKDPIGHVACTASYDALHQLTAETGVQSHSYTNDSISNRLSKNSASYTVDSANKLLASHDDAFTYDKNGNLIGTKTTTFTYDALDRLIKVSDGKNEVQYTYDNFHRRISKSTNNKTNYYVYFGQREVGLYNPSSQKLEEYRVLGLGKGAELGASVAIQLGETIYSPLHDYRGNIICLLDPKTGTPKETYRYTAFGEAETYSQNKPLNNPWGFMSKRVDPETGHVYFSRRYYAPTTGRWLTPDPLGFADGPNMYAYVHSNPLTLFDLYGLFTYHDEYDELEGAGLYGMLETSARSWIDLTSLVGIITRSETLTNKCQDWHNTLDALRVRYAETVSSMPGSTFTAQEVGKAIEVGVFARDSLDLSRLGLNVVNTVSRNSGSILRVLSKEGQALESAVKLNTKKTAQVIEASKESFAGNKLPKDHMWTRSSPFKDKNSDQLHEMFIEKGFRPKGPDPKNGLGSYINPKNERKYHIDPKDVGRYGEPNHVDVSRAVKYQGPLEKKRFMYQND